MAHTPTNWQDYPSTSTPITAAQLNRIDSLNAAAYDLIDTALGKVAANIISETLDSSSTLLNGWYIFPTSVDVETDGIIVRKNDEIIPPSGYYFTAIQRQITITSTTFSIGDTVTFAIYKPAVPIVRCTQAQYDAMQTHDPNTLYVITGD